MAARIHLADFAGVLQYRKSGRRWRSRGQLCRTAFQVRPCRVRHKIAKEILTSLQVLWIQRALSLLKFSHFAQVLLLIVHKQGAVVTGRFIIFLKA